MKETLYLLPGLLCDRVLWRHQIEYLSGTFDVRVADFSLGDSIEVFAQNVLSDAPEQFSIAGLSMGGYVAFEILRTAPQRVKRLALLDTSPYADLPEHREFRQSMMGIAREEGLGAVQDVLIPRLIHSSRYEDEELVRVIDAMAHRVGVESFLSQQTALLDRQDSFEDLQKIKCDSLVVVGRQDSMTPVSIAKKMAGQIENCALVEIENCGHLSTLEQPEAVTALLSYWMQIES